MTSVALVPSLVDRCVGGEAEAWRQLHRELFPVVASFLRRMGIPRGESDDVCQEVFVQMFRALKTFEGRADIKTWVFRLCVSQASRWRRRSWLKGSLRFLRVGGGTRVLEESVALATMPEGELHRGVEEALTRMKPQHREVLVLFELEGLAGEQIARVLSCPVATVWRRLHYARLEFRSLLEEREGNA